MCSTYLSSYNWAGVVYAFAILVGGSMCSLKISSAMWKAVVNPKWTTIFNGEQFSILHNVVTLWFFLPSLVSCSAWRTCTHLCGCKTYFDTFSIKGQMDFYLISALGLRRLTTHTYTHTHTCSGHFVASFSGLFLSTPFMFAMICMRW